MTSFVNLRGNDVWSEADIKAHLHAEIRSEVSELAESELNRALQGKMLGMHTMTADEIALLMRFKSATDRVALLGAQARTDMALLNAVLLLERAFKRLEVSPVADSTVDEEDRLAAKILVDTASPAALALNLLRNPPAATSEALP